MSAIRRSAAITALLAGVVVDATDFAAIAQQDIITDVQKIAARGFAVSLEVAA